MTVEKIDNLNPSDLSLIATESFEHGTYPFKNFNYLQTLAYDCCNKDINLVVSASTSAGKTIVAELAIADTIAKGKKAIFLSPLKAVTSEKYDDWTSKEHYFSNYKIEIVTGDHRLNQSRIKKINEADLVLMTSEMLDTRTRYNNSEASKWLAEVGIVVVDEAHLLTTNRGPALEIGLMKFSEQVPDCRIMLLSATMTNCRQIASWVDLLNNKNTKYIDSDWRPVDLHVHNIYGTSELSEAQYVTEILTCSKQQLATYLTSSNSIERQIAERRIKGGVDSTKTLLFVHTKKIGKALEGEFKKLGINAQFHNADLDKTKRKKLEKQFRQDLDVLISTSTLAWGINLPCRNVVVLGGMRGTEKVSPLDIAQMSGRAGRFGMYERGDVYLINCEKQDQFIVESKLENHLAFHIVAEVYSKTFNTIDGAVKWFSRALDSHPAGPIRREFNKLIEWGCLRKLEDDTYQVTDLGKIARDLYLDPYDIYTWKQNFSIVEKNDRWECPATLAWAIASETKMYRFDYVPSNLRQLNRQMKFEFDLMTKITNEAYVATIFYRLAKDKIESYMHRNYDIATAAHLQTLLKDSGRVFNALKRISILQKWDREEDFEVIKARVVHGVGKHLIELVKIPGIGGTIATQLYKAGFRTLNDIIEKKDDLSNYIERKANVTRILKGLKQLEEDIDF